jgi:hypothetical protein
MKKLIVLSLVLMISSVADAAVIDAVAYDVGQSGGRLGGAADPLLPNDIIGIKLVLNHNPYPVPGFSSYDGYMLSNMNLTMNIAGPGSLDAGTKDQGDPVWQHHPDLLAFIVMDSNISDGFDAVAAIALPSIEAAPGGTDLFWDLLLHCDGEGDVTIDLALYGLTEYSQYKTGIGGGPIPGWSPATENDLGDLVIHQIPEPITITLLSLGGLLLKRKH